MGATLLAPAHAQERAALQLPSGKLLRADVVADPESRARGLMFRSEAEFQPDQAMVFLFEREDRQGFWMKNMNFAIDILWLASDLSVVHVEADVPPCTREPCPVYEPQQKAQFVIELYRGTAKAEGLAVGDVLRLTSEPPSAIR